MPTAITLHDVDVESDAELLGWLGVVKLAFKDHGPLELAQVQARRASYRGTRVTAARDGADLVGTFRSWDTELTVPGGGWVSADAISGVTVLPTHRRRGVMTSMLRRDLDLAVERGLPVAVLLPAEAPIYAPFGFGPSTECAEWTADLATARMRPEAPRGGRVRIVPGEQLRGPGPGIYQVGRAAGDISRRDPWWDAQLGVTEVSGQTDRSMIAVLATDDQGHPQGYLRYTAKADWVDRSPRTVTQVHDLRAATTQAYADLWGFLLELDGVATVHATERPVDEHLPLLLQDPRGVRQTGRCDFLWSRVLDPASVLSARDYESDGEVVLQVDDPGGPAQGTFELAAHGGRGACTRTGRPAEVVLGVEVLGALWLGGGDLHAYRRAGRARELAPGALARLAALLRTGTAPWSSTWF